jgi:FdhE protein
MTAPQWDKRIERAGELIGTYPEAAELLTFYREIARFQNSVFDLLRKGERTDVRVLLPQFPALLALIKRVGPPELADYANTLSLEPESWEELLAAAWDGDHGEESETFEIQAFFGRALLQPYAEYMASRGNFTSVAVEPICPFCGGKPAFGVLRAEGEGAKRSLVCALCATEWDFRRIVCAACGEEHKDKLPVYTAAGFSHVRVDACEECRTYIKSIDLTKNGLAVPVVDELASVSLDVWATDHGYTKLQPNLLGI